MLWYREKEKEDLLLDLLSLSEKGERERRERGERERRELRSCLRRLNKEDVALHPRKSASENEGN